MNIFCCINGEFVNAETASIPVTDLGLQRGFAVFDYFLVCNKQPHLMHEHLLRLQQSAALMNIEIPYSLLALSNMVLQLVAKNGFENSGIKILVTGGNSMDGFMPGKPNVIITNNPYKWAETSDYKNGCTLLLHSYERYLPEAKSTNYLEAIRLLPQMKKANAIDVLYYDDDSIRETSRSNFFMVKDACIYTANENILKGITRMQVKNLINKLGLTLVETNITIEDLKTASEAFITSTTKRIMPVKQIGEIVINNGVVGPLTKQLMQELSKEYLVLR